MDANSLSLTTNGTNEHKWICVGCGLDNPRQKLEDKSFVFEFFGIKVD